MLLGKSFNLTNAGTRFLYGIAVCVGILLLGVIVFSPKIPRTVHLKINSVANETVISPRLVELETSADKKMTAQLRAQAERNSLKIYVNSAEVNSEVMADLNHLLIALDDMVANARVNRRSQVPDALKFLSKSSIRTLSTISPVAYSSAKYVILESAQSLLQSGIEKVDTANLTLQLQEKIRQQNLGPSISEFVTQIVLKAIRPNLFFDEEKTKDALEKKLSALRQTTLVKEGQPILYKGDVVTQRHIDILTELGMIGVKINFYEFAGMVGMTAIFAAIIFQFSRIFVRRVHKHPKYLVLMYVVMLIVVLLGRVINAAAPLNPKLSLYFLIPVSLSTMVLSILVSPNLGMIVGTAISALIAAMFNYNFDLFFYLFVSNCATVYILNKRYRQSELISAGFYIGLVNICLVGVIGLLSQTQDIAWYGIHMGLAFLNGIFSIMISLAILPYLESIFRITTSQRLLETSNLSHPLLKRLMITAPGTYQHSLMVANLAEAAAEAIGADVVLCRIGSYFHDIGKMKRPNFYTENQFSGENPHHQLNPRMSKLIIAAHPKDGVDMATKHKLPEVLKDFMMQHHGTSLVSFFYVQARQLDDVEGAETTEDEFRYPGPKPQFREAGVVMLADSVEAAVRSMGKPTLYKIENLVNQIVKAKLDDRQLDDCRLSLTDIKVIKETFLKIFKGIYHQRLDYKEELTQFSSEHRKDADLK